MTHWQPGNSDLPTSGVTAGTYGDSTHVGQFTVAASGVVTAASNVAISGGGGGGTELDYVEITSNVSVTGGVGAQVPVITGSSLSYDGSTRIRIEFYAPVIEAAASVNAFVACELWDGSTDLCEIVGSNNPASSAVIDLPCYAVRYLTPTAATHQYIIKAFRQTGGSNGLVAAGNGSGGNFAPAFLRISTA
jgi:hypothetical protein